MRQVKIPRIVEGNLDNAADLRSFNKKQIQTKGFEIGLQANTTTSQSLTLGGKWRKMHGIVMFVETPTDNDKVSLNINSELIIDNCNANAFIPQQNSNATKPDQFFPIPRALSGSDSVEININTVAGAAKKAWIVFYLSEA